MTARGASDTHQAIDSYIRLEGCDSIGCMPIGTNPEWVVVLIGKQRCGLAQVFGGKKVERNRLCRPGWLLPRSRVGIQRIPTGIRHNGVSCGARCSNRFTSSSSNAPTIVVSSPIATAWSIRLSAAGPASMYT